VAYRALLIEYSALLMEYRALLIVYTADLWKYRAHFDRRTPPPSPSPGGSSFWVVRSQKPEGEIPTKHKVLKSIKIYYLALCLNLFFPDLEIEPPKNQTGGGGVPSIKTRARRALLSTCM